MPKRLLARIASFFFVMCVQQATAQNTDLSIEWFGGAGGVEFGASTAVFQDSFGFMWFGTNGGLIKYDGYEIEFFAHDPDDSTSLSSPGIESIYEDRNGVLWLGTIGNGLNKFNREINTFTRFLHDETDPTSIPPGMVATLLEDQSGIFWVGTDKGVAQFDSEAGTFLHHVHPTKDPPELHQSRVKNIFEDQFGRLWFATNDVNPNGLFRYDPSSESFIHYKHIPRDHTSLYANRVNGVYEDSRGDIWVTTSGGMLHRYDPLADAFERYFLDPKNPNSAATPVHLSFVSPPEYRHYALNYMIETSAQPGFLWIGSFGRGLYRIDLTTRSLAHFSSASHSSPQMQNDNAWGLFEDKWGTLWVTGHTAGLHKIHNRYAWVSHLTFEFEEALNDGVPFRLWEDANGFIWYGKEGAIYRLNAKNRDIESLGDSFKQKVESFGYPERISMLREDVLLQTDQNEFVFYNPVSGTVKAIKNDLMSSTESPSQIITEGFEDTSGNVWFGGENGALLKYEPETGGIETVLHVQEQNISEISLEDAEGRIWCKLGVGTGQNLARVDPSRRTYDLIDMKNRIANRIVEDRSGTFWIGTAGAGLIQYDPSIERTTTITIQDGLPSNGVAGPLIDDKGVLWFRSGSKLTRFDPEEEFFISTDLTSISEAFSKGFGSTTFKSRDGTLYFGNDSGLLQVHPGLFATDSLAPSIVFTDFRIDNLSAPIAENSPLTSHISVAEEIVLTHNDNDITFEFAALDFENPQENTYSYLLDNYDDTWIDSGTQRTATYTNLDPGTYTFRVKGANSLGIWNETGSSIAITILPPWWRTWWAYIGYGLLLVASVIVVDRFQRRRLIARERLRAEREKATAIESTNNELERALKHLTETQDQLIHTEKMASLGQLTAGIAHEIKNPLNFVNNFSQLSMGMMDELVSMLKEKQGLEDEEIEEVINTLKLNASKIHEHGERADGIIRSMLEHSRTGRGDRRAVDINKLVDEYVNLAYHGARAREQGLDVKLNRAYDQDTGKIDIYPQEIGRVLINLLDNAFYTVNEKRLSVNGGYEPQVSVSTKKADGYVELRIRDNGLGIPKDMQEKIFEPFFTSKPTGSGTGLGLSLSHDIVVKGHGGQLLVESKEGDGATFIVQLPAKNNQG